MTNPNALTEYLDSDNFKTQCKEIKNNSIDNPIVKTLVQELISASTGKPMPTGKLSESQFEKHISTDDYKAIATGIIEMSKSLNT
ncbi:MAG: hypothetical protein ACHP6I_03250, partial [Rickettsiales bacterium]